MIRPGGDVHPEGTRVRQHLWAPLTGDVENAICEARHCAQRAPELAVAVLEAALASLYGRPAERDEIERLPVVEARSLMIELAARFGLEVEWLTRTCAECGEPFDIPIDFSILPIPAADRNASEADAETRFGRLRFRVPNCADQIAIVGDECERRAMRALVARCLATRECHLDSGWADELNDQDIESISEALETISPEVPWAVEAQCPTCSHRHIIPIDATAWVFRLDDPVSDVHEIANAYGWTEGDILSLSRVRRQRYLSLIRRSNAELAETS